MTHLIPIDRRPLVIRSEHKDLLVIVNLERLLEDERREASRLRDLLLTETQRSHVMVSGLRIALRWIQAYTDDGVVHGYASKALEAMAKWENGE